MSADTPITLGLVPGEFSIHRLPADADLTEVLAGLREHSGHPETLLATLHSRDELSIVCDASLPVATQHSSGPWCGIRVLGELDFALTGILAALAAPLAAANISIFAISSYNTDYLLVRAHALGKAVKTLEHAGFTFAEQPGAEG